MDEEEEKIQEVEEVDGKKAINKLADPLTVINIYMSAIILLGGISAVVYEMSGGGTVGSLILGMGSLGVSILSVQGILKEYNKFTHWVEDMDISVYILKKAKLQSYSEDKIGEVGYNLHENGVTQQDLEKRYKKEQGVIKRIVSVPNIVVSVVFIVGLIVSILSGLNMVGYIYVVLVLSIKVIIEGLVVKKLKGIKRKKTLEAIGVDDKSMYYERPYIDRYILEYGLLSEEVNIKEKIEEVEGKSKKGKK